MQLIENCIGLYMYRLSPWCSHGGVWELQASVLSGDGLWLASRDSGKNVSANEMGFLLDFSKVIRVWQGGDLRCFTVGTVVCLQLSV
jgi:hypothetical protein